MDNPKYRINTWVPPTEEEEERRMGPMPAAILREATSSREGVPGWASWAAWHGIRMEDAQI